jgi:adenylate kinase family enzyme
MDQVLEFERTIGSPRQVISYECPLDILLERLVERGKTSGRADDNLETIKKRFRIFEQESLPVIQYFERKNALLKVIVVNVDLFDSITRTGIQESIVSIPS